MPSLGLAPIILERVAKTIKEIHANGTTVLLVEKKAYLALQRSDRACVPEPGRIVKEGNSKSLRSDCHVKDAYLGSTTSRSGKTR